MKYSVNTARTIHMPIKSDKFLGKLLHRIPAAPLSQGFSVMVAELGRLFRREVLFIIRVQVLLHLLDDMFGFVKILNIQICRGPCNLLGMTALRAEFPLLETVNVRERSARGAPDDEVHDNEVIGVIVINKYRRFAEKPDLWNVLNTCRERSGCAGLAGRLVEEL
jgi:hypothetical protein